MVGGVLDEGTFEQPQQSTMSPQHRQPGPELAKKLSFLILSSTFTYFRNDSLRKRDYHVCVSPETILSCLCLNIVGVVLFAAIAPAKDEDGEAIERSVRGDREAFDLLVEKYYKKIYNVAYRFVGDREDANDLAQEIFTAAYKNLKRFRWDAKFSTWLFQIASNKGKNRFKYLKLRGHFVNRWQSDEDGDRDHPGSGIPDHSTNPETLLAGKELQRKMQEAIDDLDPDHKEIVILRDIEGSSYEEIAQILNLPEGTTKSRLHRARMVLKEKLKKALS